MKHNIKQYLFNFSIAFLLTLTISFTISCGGGGGGGGAAAGPSGASAAPSVGTSAAPAPTRSSAAEVISFKFEKDENDPALSEFSSDLIGNQPDSTVPDITVEYNYGKLDAQPALKPTIKISQGAAIIEDGFTETEKNGETVWTLDSPQDFFASPVTFTVKAENGTEKAWTVTLSEMAAGEYRIIYMPEGITHPYPTTYSESEDIHFDDNLYNKVIAKNYYFDGWREDESATTTIDGWNRMEKTGDVTLYAKLQPAPYADLENSKVFANGIPVTVKNNAGATMVYFNDADNKEKSLFAVNENYTNFAGFDLYAGTSGEADAPTSLTSGFAAYLSAPTGNITITGGRLNNVYGGNGNNPETALACGSNIKLSGHPEIGNQKKSGIWLKSFSGNKVIVDGLVNATNDNKITLIAAPDMSAGAVVVDATSLYTLKEHYTLRNSYRTENVELESCGNSIKIKAGISLPDQEDVTWSRDADGDYFTLGPDHFHSDGTILSIGVEGGFFKVPSATVTGGNFDMAIRYSDDSLNEYLDRYIDGDGSSSGLKTSDKLKYVQFISESGDIAASAASSFLEKVKFFIEPCKSSVKIKLNLQTVDLDYIQREGVTYFNGSFYKIKNEDSDKTNNWNTALTNAKASEFNGLTGYLMTITSQTENMFIYDRVYKKEGISQSNARGWIGAKRENGIWKWACGPEEGMEFYNQSTKEPINGRFAAWDSFKDRMRNGTWSLCDEMPGIENSTPIYTRSNRDSYKEAITALANSHPDDKWYWPNEKKHYWYVDWIHPLAAGEGDGSYDNAYYTGIYTWGNENNKHGLIIEYTAYNGVGGTPDAPVLIAEKDYSRR